MEDDPPIIDHLNSYVGNTAKSYKSRVDLNSNSCDKLIKFSNYPKRLYLKSKIANDWNEEGSKSV